MASAARFSFASHELSWATLPLSSTTARYSQLAGDAARASGPAAQHTALIQDQPVSPLPWQRKMPWTWNWLQAYRPTCPPGRGSKDDCQTLLCTPERMRSSSGARGGLCSPAPAAP